MNCAELGENAAATAGPSVVLTAAAAEIDESIGNARRCLEGWQHLISNVLRFVSEHRIASESECGKQASNESDVRFKDGNVS